MTQTPKSSWHKPTNEQLRPLGKQKRVEIMQMLLGALKKLAKKLKSRLRRQSNGWH